MVCVRMEPVVAYTRLKKYPSGKCTIEIHVYRAEAINVCSMVRTIFFYYSESENGTLTEHNCPLRRDAT